MGDNPPVGSKNETEAPAPETLATRSDSERQAEEGSGSAHTPVVSKIGKRLHRGMYHPSHRATFIGLAVVLLVLAVNAGIIAFIIRSQSQVTDKQDDREVIIDQSALDKLGVNRTAVGNLGIQLVVGPDARFNNKVDIGGEVSIGGQLKLNNKLFATDASLTQLDAGNTTLSQLNVSGDGTLTNLNLRSNLAVSGTTRLQGAVTISQLLTVNNSVNVVGSLSVGGTLSANAFHTSSLTVDSTLTIGGHIVTRGSAPAVSAGSAVGSNGTVSISGNDASGTVAVNIGAGAIAGTLANITFRNKYGSTPHVVITPIGGAVPGFYVNRSATGFSIVTGSALSPGGYAFDYVVMQ